MLTAALQEYSPGIPGYSGDTILNSGLTALSTAIHSSANQMLTFNEESLAYDLNGNLVQKGVTTYQWNARNQLIAIVGPDLSASFKYDAFGRRIEKTISGKTTQYLYDGLDIVQEIEDGMVSANYIRTLNIDEPLARIKADGSVRYYQQDALGSVVALTDESGTIKTQYVYEPFGDTSFIGEESDQPFQYTGRENDGTGLYYYRARYYSPELQRFIAEDPIGLRGGINRYVYAGDNPLLYTDPMGLINWGQTISGAAINTTGMLSIYGGGALIALGIIHSPTAITSLPELAHLLHAFTPAGGAAMIGTGIWLLDIGTEMMIEGISETECQ